MSMLDSFEPLPARMMPVILLLDTSGSMHDDGKIQVLNEKLIVMCDKLADIDAGLGFIRLSIIVFGNNEAKFVVNHQLISEVKLDTLRAAGNTPLGAAMNLAKEMVENPVLVPSSAYRPLVALLSDGKPNDAGWEGALDDYLRSERGQKSNRHALKIGADADAEMLEKFSSPNPVKEASEAGQIADFLDYVTMTVLKMTRRESNFQPSPTSNLDDPVSTYDDF